MERVAGSNLKIPVSAVSSPSICDGFVESRVFVLVEGTREEGGHLSARVYHSNRIVLRVDLCGNQMEEREIVAITFPFFIFFLRKLVGACIEEM